MNKVFLIGRLTHDPEVRVSGDTTIARYTIAVDRRTKDRGADFINCVAFGKSAEFAEKYLTKGIKIAVSGHIQTGGYDHKDGYKVYTTDVVVEESEFCEKKGSNEQTDADGFVNVPVGIDEELPFR